MAFRQPFVGLYITPTQIEAVHCRFGKGGRVQIAAAHRLELPSDVIDAEGTIQKEQILATKLKELWQQARLPTRSVVLALWGKKSIVRLIQMPRMKTLYQAILAESEGYALYREDSDLILDYHELGPAEAEYGPVIFTVTTRRIVTTWRKCLKLAGLKLLAMDSAQMAAQRGLAFCHGDSEEPWMGAALLPQKLIISYWSKGVATIWREVMLASDFGTEGDFSQMADRFENELSRTLASESGLPDKYNILIAGDDMDNSLQLGLYLNERGSIPAEVAGFFRLMMEESIPDTLHEISLVTLGSALWSRQEEIPSFDVLRHEKTWVDVATAAALRVMQPVVDTLAAHGAKGAAATAEWYQAQGRYLFAGLISGSILAAAALTFAWLERNRMDAQAQSLQSEITATQVLLERPSAAPSVDPLVAQQEQMKQLLESRRSNRFPLQFLIKLQEIIPSDTWISNVSAGDDNQLSIEGASMQKGSFFQFLNTVLAMPEIRKLQTMDSREVPGAHQFKITLLFNPNPSPSVPPALVGGKL